MTLVLDRRVRRKLSTSKGSGSRCCEIGRFGKRACVFKRIEPRYTGDCEGASPRSKNCALPLHSACCCTWPQTSIRLLALHFLSPRPVKSESLVASGMAVSRFDCFLFLRKQTRSVKHRCAPITMSITELPSSLFLARRIKKRRNVDEGSSFLGSLSGR